MTPHNRKTQVKLNVRNRNPGPAQTSKQQANPSKSSGGAALAREADASIGHVEEDAVVLLLHAGDDVEHGVDAVGRRGHGQAADGPVRAMDNHVLLRQRHLHAVEQQRHGRPRHGGGVEARVEPSQ